MPDDDPIEVPDGARRLLLGPVDSFEKLYLITTSLTVGSGGSGGVFAPGMVIGGMLGASFWRLGHGALPYLPEQPTAFVIIGMMALFGAIAHAPLAVMLMVSEMTGNLSLLAPAMIAVAISTALVGDESIYQSQLRDRSRSPFHRVRLSFPMLSALLVRDAMTASPPEAVIDEMPAPLQPDDTLDVALGRLVDAAKSEMAVVEKGRLVGRLTVKNILQTYKATLGRSVRRATALPHDTSLFEARLPASSPLVGRTLAEAGLPRDALVVSIARNGETLFPRAATRIETGDVVMVTTPRAHEDGLRAFLEGEGSKGPA